MENISIAGMSIPVYNYDAVVIGSGAAGYNAADTLFSLGVTNIAVITEGREMGTSRNTGSDKQTYFKISTSGSDADSVYDTAKAFFDGGSMNGDTALIEAAYSLRAFYKLVNLGVPFPKNEYGEYVGYMTDNDTRRRATSCGPLTSKYMTAALEREVMKKNIPVLNGHRVIKILTDNGRAVGVITLRRASINDENPLGASVFLAENTVYAVGGPSAIYANSVYPQSQTCAIGAALEAGAEGANLTESQYGIASVGFRWNLSGTYQQVIPRYVSRDENGSEREFLFDYFDTPGDVFNAVFFKGYRWPFSPEHLGGEASSKIDLAVHAEAQKGNRVFIDYTRDPQGFDFALLCDEARSYLENSGALCGTPIERLKKMNIRAVELYGSHGIDLEKDMVEIAVCAQHNNGGLAVDKNYESTTLHNFYPVGECAGVFGVRRPGGSALNSTQVSSMRAAEHIAKKLSDFSFAELSSTVTDEIESTLEDLLAVSCGDADMDFIVSKRLEYGKIMSDCGAFKREIKSVLRAIEYYGNEIENFKKTYSVAPEYASQAMINRDILITSYTYLCAIREYISDGGLSRGSYIIERDGGVFPPEIDKAHFDKVQYTLYDGKSSKSRFEARRKIPQSEQWFEKVYNK